VIGFVGLTSAAERAAYVTAFQDGLKESGFVDRRDVAVVYRWADGHYERLPGIVAEFLKRPVDVIVTLHRRRCAWPRQRPPQFRLSSLLEPTPLRFRS
jgi:hypothetical protein